MDIEDWYHLAYLDRSQCDVRYSMLDGLEVFLDVLARHHAPASVFCTGEIAASIAPQLRTMLRQGHDIGSHTESHVRPLLLSIDQFDAELETSKRKLEDILGTAVPGFRAPCFSLDDARLERVIRAGHLYDSSRMAFRGNPMYGQLRLESFEKVHPFVFRRGDFFEFQMSTLTVAGKAVPVSGGGYLKSLPWWLMGSLIERYLKDHVLYVLYVHPYELSRRRAPVLPHGLGALKKQRLRVGLGSVEAKLERLIRMLKAQGFAFTTFATLRERLLAADGSQRLTAGRQAC
jgi:peptidoglycan/xylan/chitin deacetylase (PgdA/CDA1 family)